MLFSDSNDKLANDYELQSWAKELVEDKSKGGCGIKVRFELKAVLGVTFTLALCF